MIPSRNIGRLDNEVAQGGLGKERKLIENSVNQSEATVRSGEQEGGTADDPPSSAALPETMPAGNDAARQRESRRGVSTRDLVEVDQPATGTEGTDDAAPVVATGRTTREERRAAREKRRLRPIDPLAGQPAASASPETRDETQGTSDPAPVLAASAAESVPFDFSGKKPNRFAQTLKRARRKQQNAAAAAANASDNPSLGALNRHLSIMVQQLGAAHRLIGRIVVERDSLRQQLADLQGVPLEEIVVTTGGVSPDEPVNAAMPPEPRPKTEL
jgi:hypothetical protein